jgi:NADP-dependent 3-hydroxy acid dehydrogenase YdfG
MSTNIEGKVVVITGASSGLGESTARYLAELGATVVLGARRKDRLDAIVKDITAKGGKALAGHGRLAQSATVRTVARLRWWSSVAPSRRTRKR